MKHALRVCAAIVLLWPRTLPGQDQRPPLLPTQLAAARVRDIQGRLAVDLKPETLQVDKAQHEQLFGQLKKVVTNFVVAQLNAAPEMKWWQMRGQLIRVLGTKYAEDAPDHFHEPPYAFRGLRLSKEDPIVWALAYKGDAFPGMGGSRVVVESYAVENGKARLAGRGGSEMDGYDLKAEQIWNPSANSTSILIHGILLWASGHVLPAAASIYAVSPAGVNKLWTLAAPGLNFVGTEDNLFVIAYHDEHRHGDDLPSTAIDVYSVNTGHGIPNRIVHQFIQ